MALLVLKAIPGLNRPHWLPEMIVPDTLFLTALLERVRGRLMVDWTGSHDRMAKEGTVLCQICRELKKQDDIVPAQSVPEPMPG
jgi:hypothetical protein